MSPTIESRISKSSSRKYKVKEKSSQQSHPERKSVAANEGTNKSTTKTKENNQISREEVNVDNVKYSKENDLKDISIDLVSIANNSHSEEVIQGTSYAKKMQDVTSQSVDDQRLTKSCPINDSKDYLIGKSSLHLTASVLPDVDMNATNSLLERKEHDESCFHERKNDTSLRADEKISQNNIPSGLDSVDNRNASEKYLAKSDDDDGSLDDLPSSKGRIRRQAGEESATQKYKDAEEQTSSTLEQDHPTTSIITLSATTVTRIEGSDNLTDRYDIETKIENEQMIDIGNKIATVRPITTEKQTEPDVIAMSTDKIVRGINSVIDCKTLSTNHELVKTVIGFNANNLDSVPVLQNSTRTSRTGCNLKQAPTPLKENSTDVNTIIGETEVSTAARMMNVDECLKDASIEITRSASLNVDNLEHSVKETVTNQTEIDVDNGTTVVDENNCIKFTMNKVIEDILTCPLCNGMYREPIKTLKCYHTFCKSCYLVAYEYCKFYDCPTCQTYLGQDLSKAILPDRALENVIDKILFPPIGTPSAPSLQKSSAFASVPVASSLQNNVEDGTYSNCNNDAYLEKLFYQERHIKPKPEYRRIIGMLNENDESDSTDNSTNVVDTDIPFNGGNAMNGNSPNALHNESDDENDHSSSSDEDPRARRCASSFNAHPYPLKNGRYRTRRRGPRSSSINEGNSTSSRSSSIATSNSSSDRSTSSDIESSDDEPIWNLVKKRKHIESRDTPNGDESDHDNCDNAETSKLEVPNINRIEDEISFKLIPHTHWIVNNMFATSTSSAGSTAIGNVAARSLPPLDMEYIQTQGRIRMGQLKQYICSRLQSLTSTTGTTLMLNESQIEIYCNSIPLGNELSVKFVLRTIWIDPDLLNNTEHTDLVQSNHRSSILKMNTNKKVEEETPFSIPSSTMDTSSCKMSANVFTLTYGYIQPGNHI